MPILTTTIPSFSGGAKLTGPASSTDGVTTLADVLTDHATAIETLNTAQAAALSAAATVGLTGIVKQSVTVTQAADLAGVGTASMTKNLGAALPANARFIGCAVNVTTLISGGGLSTATISVGVTAGSAVAAIGAAVNVFTGQTGFPKAPTAGAQGYPLCSLSSLQPTVTVTVSGLCSSAIAGSLSVDLFYIVLP